VIRSRDVSRLHCIREWKCLLSFSSLFSQDSPVLFYVDDDERSSHIM
jgi:hypothetical protein